MCHFSAPSWAGRPLPNSGGAAFPEAEAHAGRRPVVTGAGVTVPSGQPGPGRAGVVWVEPWPPSQAVGTEAPRCPGSARLPVPLKGERGV